MMSLRLSLLLSLFLFAAAAAAAALSGALPRCQDRCGNVGVPYPFGIGEGCYLPGFRMTCNDSMMFIDSGDMLVRVITDDQLTVDTLIARNCYKPLNVTWTPYTNRTVSIDVTGTPYTLSYERNLFTAIGCGTFGLYHTIPTAYTSGCVAYCGKSNSRFERIVYCQTAIPPGERLFNTTFRRTDVMKDTNSLAVSPCSFAFLVDREWYVFAVADLVGFGGRNTVPTVLDWAIGNRTCKEVEGATDYACGPNSECLNSTNGPGYRCRCNSGYEGNPYLPGGCQDVDECADGWPCVEICTNTPGSYVCSCSGGKTGDGKKSGTGCIRVQSEKFPLVQVVLGVGLGSVFLLVIASSSYWALKKRKMIVLREKYFKQNGGLLLQQQIASRDRGAAV